MFTGAVSLEEFSREHTIEYRRLVETGELAKYLVDAPARPMALGARILGFTLLAFGLILLILVVTGFVGRLNEWDVNLGWIKFRHLGWSQIEALRKASFEIESHTVNHPDLTRTGDARLKSELGDSKKAIEDRLGARVRFLSFPFGRYDSRVLDAMRHCGYERGVGFWLANPSDKSLVFERRAYYLFDGSWNLRAKLGHNAMTALEDVKLRCINFFSHGTALVKPHRE
jgi:hypothetical protein